MKRIGQWFWVIGLLVLVRTSLVAQILPTIEGTLQDETGQPLEAATVVLLALPDSVVQVYSLTNPKGAYQLKAPKGNYALQVSYLGYQSLSLPLLLQKDTSLGTLSLQPLTDTLKVVEVTAKHIPVQMRGDTLSFNSAAFKVRSHDDADKLLRQLPGLTIQEDGTILFNGQKVTEVLVDGKVFFGDDAQATLRTLSADAIKKIDITDTKINSKGVEVEGDEKTINLRLKKKAKTGTAGSIGLGYGHIVPPTNTTPSPENFGDNRYQADASLTYFTPNIRSAIYGRSSNIPAPNPFAMNQTVAAGIVRKHNVGATFNWVPSTNTTWNNSYRWAEARNTLKQNSRELSSLPEQSFERLKEQEQVIVPSRHNFNSNLMHKLDQNHLFRIRLMASYTDNKSQFNRLENSFEEALLQNSLTQNYQQQQEHYLLVPSVAFEKKFEKKGRQVIVNLGSKWSNQPRTNNNEALTDLYDNAGNYTRTDTLFQEQERFQEEQSYNANVLWKEPLSKKDELHITLKGGWEQDNSGQTTFDLEGNTRLINPLLTNKFQRSYNYQALLVSWRRKIKVYRLEVAGGVRRSLLLGVSATNSLRQEFYLPTGQAQFRYNIAKGKKLIFTYNLSLIELNISQLQPFVDNADPLAVQLGNTNLQPTANHRITARLDWFEQSNFSNFYTKLSSLIVPNTIIQQQYIDEDLRLTYQPINSTLSSNLRLQLGYNRLFQNLDLVLDISVSGNREQRPFVLNGNTQQQTRYDAGLTLKLGNKKKEVVDWGINTDLSGGLFSYNTTTQSLNEYLNQYYGGYFGVEFLKHWEAKTSFGLQVFAQSGGGEDPTIALWSVRIKRHFMENEQLELELSAENLLNESARLQRSQQAFFLTEYRTQNLGRYLMLSLRYKFRKKN